MDLLPELHGDLNPEIIALKEAVGETLEALMMGSSDSRNAAEERIKALEVTEEYGVILVDFVIYCNSPLPIRQMAAVLLRQYVEAHWCSSSEKFRPPEAPELTKTIVKDILPHGLRDSESKIRGAVASIIASIASWDWPDHWSLLLNIIIQNLTGIDINALQGSLKLLAELTDDLASSQLPDAIPEIFAHMYKILDTDQKFDTQIRGTAVDIFVTCCINLSCTFPSNSSIMKKIVNPVLPVYTEKFVQVLLSTDEHVADWGIKTDIIKALTLLVQEYPKQMSKLLNQFLPAVWQTFTESAKIYWNMVVNASDKVPDLFTKDGKGYRIESTISELFDFVTTLMDNKRYIQHLKSVLTDLVYFIIICMQITSEQIQKWSVMPFRYLEDDDEESVRESIRNEARDLIRKLECELTDCTAHAVCQAVVKHVEATAIPHRTNVVNWWKVHEACMMVLGLCKTSVINHIRTGILQFDIAGFHQSVILQDMNASFTVLPLALGRCLWVASNFASDLPSFLNQQFLQATVNALQENQVLLVRLAAIRAVHNFAIQLKDDPSSVNMLVQHLPSVIENVMSMACTQTPETLCVILDALSSLIGIDSAITCTYAPRMASLCVSGFIRYSHDPFVISAIDDIIRELLRLPNSPVHDRFIPSLVNILTSSNDTVYPGKHCVALDILHTIVRYSNIPLHNELINTAFPAAVHCILYSADISTMESGSRCIQAYISRAPEKICAYHDSEGHGGLWYILQVADFMLNPASEQTSTNIGRLITVLISKMGNILGENLDLLLKGVLSKMQVATKQPSVMQSLIMVYAHLINSQLDAVLNFLGVVPGPTGGSALEFVLTEWSNRQQMFFGRFDLKVSIIALSTLLEYGITQHDERLKSINVYIEIFSPSGSGVQTRSQATERRVVCVPLLVKLFKILISELTSLQEENNAGTNEEESETDDDEEAAVDEISENNKDVLNKDSQHYNSFVEEDDDDFEGQENEDIDLIEDPRYQIELHSYLPNFLQNFSKQTCFHEFCNHLSSHEKQTLLTAGITC